MASFLQSSFSLIIIPNSKLKLHRYQQQVRVRAQALGDEGRSTNMVDASMNVLRERIEDIRKKETLRRCYKVEPGWCYSPGYDHTRKRNVKSSESLELIVMFCNIFGLTIATSSLLLCILSILIHLRPLAQ